MKKTLLTLIIVYQAIFSGIIKNLLGINRMCRFTPSCSEYTKISIEKKGIIKGGVLAIKRFLKCQPFNKEYAFS